MITTVLVVFLYFPFYYFFLSLCCSNLYSKNVFLWSWSAVRQIVFVLCIDYHQCTFLNSAFTFYFLVKLPLEQLPVSFSLQPRSLPSSLTQTSLLLALFQLLCCLL